MLLDLLKAFDFIENSHKSDMFILQSCVTCYDLPSNISTMVRIALIQSDGTHAQ